MKNRKNVWPYSVACILAAGPTVADEASDGGTTAQIEGAPTGQVLDEDGLKTWLLPEYIVTPTGFEQRTFDSPYVLDVVTSEDMRDFGIRSVPEALRYTPGVMVQRTAHGQGSPFIRGFTAFRNVFLIDGVRLNNSTFREGPNQYWNTIDPFSIKRFEIVKGPTSVIYGSDAIGGTVNAITNSPYGYDKTHNLSGRVQMRFATNERSVGGRGELSPTFNNGQQQFGVLLGGSFSEFGDLQGGSQVGRQNNTGYDQYGADLKAEYFLGDSSRLIFAHQRFRQNNAPRTHRTTAGTTWEGLTSGNDQVRDFDQERDLTYLQLHTDSVEGGPIDAFKAGVSWQNAYEERDRVTGGGGVRLQDVRVGTLGFFAQAQSEVSEHAKLTYGIDYYHDEVGSSSITNGIQGPIADNASYDLLGLYLQGDIQITEDTLLILGGRWNYAAANAGSVDNPLVAGSNPTTPGNVISIDDSWNAFVGSARIVHDLMPDELALFGGVSQGFRAPNLSDLTRLDQSQTNVIETPSPNLDPEYFYAFEIGLKGKGEHYGWQASYYYTLVQDQVVRTPTGVVIGADNEFTKQNIGDGYVNGIELDGTYRPTNNLSLFANAAWMLGEVDNILTPGGPIVTEYISRNMPITVNAGARYDIPDSPAWVYGVVQGAERARFLNSANRADTSRIPPGGTPAYVVMNVGGGWEFSENLVLTVTLENITNEDYRVNGSGVNAAGFGAIVGIDWLF